MASAILFPSRLIVTQRNDLLDDSTLVPALLKYASVEIAEWGTGSRKEGLPGRNCGRDYAYEGGQTPEIAVVDFPAGCYQASQTENQTLSSDDESEWRRSEGERNWLGRTQATADAVVSAFSGQQSRRYQGNRFTNEVIGSRGQRSLKLDFIMEPKKRANEESIWSMYLTRVEKTDRDLAEDWKGNTDGILIITGLFSATVAAFVIDSYKNLQPDPNSATIALLSQISAQLAAASNGTHLPFPSPIVSTFQPSSSAIRINILWFLSLILSVSCALGATLIQQWARLYLHAAQLPHEIPIQTRGPVRAYVFMGVQRFHMSGAIEGLPALLHTSVALFMAGLIDFLFSINTLVAYVLLAVIVAGLVAYSALTVLPFIFLDCPYQTPVTPLLRMLWVSVRDIPRWARSYIKKALVFYQQHRGRPYPDVTPRYGVPVRKSHLSFLNFAAASSAKLPFTVLHWVMLEKVGDKELETFIEALPTFLRTTTNNTGTVASLLERPDLTSECFGYLLQETRLQKLTGPERARCVLSCMHTIRFLNESRDDVSSTWLSDFLQSIYILSKDPNPASSLSAFCTLAGLAEALLRSNLSFRSSTVILILARMVDSIVWRRLSTVIPDAELWLVSEVDMDAMRVELSAQKGDRARLWNIETFITRILGPMSGASASDTELLIDSCTILTRKLKYSNSSADLEKLISDSLLPQIAAAADERGLQDVKALLESGDSVTQCASPYARLYAELHSLLTTVELDVFGQQSI